MNGCIELQRRIWLFAAPLLALIYLFGLTTAGLLGPDEPRYAAVAREMARSGDWITPRLWGQPWFEKPALLYWMTGVAFRFGLGEELAPRLPIALVSILFLIFYQRILEREFGSRASWFATAILGTSAGWLGYSYAAVTDLPMTAAFSASMLLLLGWIEKGETRHIPAAAFLLGIAVLAKGLVPLVLTAPLVWFGRKRWRDWTRARAMLPFVAVAVPWYLLCYLKNGSGFINVFFWQHQVDRFGSGALQHEQPFWYYAPVLLAGLLPWAPLTALLPHAQLYGDRRTRFLLLWLVFGFMFFSVSINKLPGYLLPLLPAAAALMGIALAERRRAVGLLFACALPLILVPAIAGVLPQALAVGISRSHIPSFHWTWLVPLIPIAAISWLEYSGRRRWAVGLGTVAAAIAVLFLKAAALPAIDLAVSARPLWRQIASRREDVCVAETHRSWRYGLNYYSVVPLPDCAEQPKPVQIRQTAGRAALLVTQTSGPADY